MANLPPGYGRPAAPRGPQIIELDASEIAPELDPAERQKRVMRIAVEAKRVIESPDFRPQMLPEVAVQLSQMAGKPNVDIAQVEKTVSADPSVAAQILSRANSAFASRGIPIQSLRNAITRLGLSDVRDVAFQVVAKSKLFRVAEFAPRMRDLLDQAQSAGVLAKEVCKKLHLEPDLAYLCGLLHDVGEALSLGILADVAKTMGGPDQITQDVRDEFVGRYHCAIGAKACELWKLPPTISDAVFFHHTPERSTHPSQMAKIVAVADRLLAHAGIGTEKRPCHPMGEPMFYALNLRPDDVTALLKLAEELELERRKPASDPAKPAAEAPRPR